MSKRHDQANSLLRDLVAQFLNENKQAGKLITVTRCEMAENFKTAICFLTIFPARANQEALAQSRASLHDLREWLRDKLKWKTLPVLDFSLEKSDKNTEASTV